MRKIDHLYIIGNGFDRYHGLMTGYNHFREYVRQNDIKLFELIEKYYNYKQKDFWYNFEENLAMLDDDNIREYCINYLEDYGCDNWRDAYHHDYQYEISRIIESLTDRLYSVFEEWLSSIDISNVSKRGIILDKDAFFLSFNYTQTLEKVYNIPKNHILHIHGKYDNNQKEKLIYGHGGYDYTLDKNIEDPRVYEGEKIIMDYFYTTTKPVKQIIHRNRKFFYKMISDIKKITIIGHSMNVIDYPYFKRICNNISSKVDWTYYYYSIEDIWRCLVSLNSRLRIDSDTIHFLPYSL